MNGIVRMLVAPAAVALLLGACGEDATSPLAMSDLPRELTAAERQLVQGSNDFALGLLREAAAADPAAPNVFLSPLSASFALGMTANGADGGTWAEMRDVLGFEGLEEAAINASFRDLMALLLGLDPRTDLGLANSIWTRDGYPVVPDFYDRARTYFDAEVTELDFSDPGAPGTINDWVEDATGGRIEEMVGTLSPQTVMILLNAVHFKGDWTYKFDPRNTATGPFALADGSSAPVPLMRQMRPFRGFHVGGVRGVEMPYGAGAFTAVAVLPPEDTSARELVATLDAATWADWTARLDGAEPSETVVVFPRLEIAYEQELNEALQSLGMNAAFGGGADFSRMVPGGGVWIDLVKQKTFLRIDEEGTEAAAATSVVVVESAPPELRFDRPFLFALRERFSGTILFIGIIGDPTA